MRITNHLNLPAPLVKAVTPLPRVEVPNRISITTLSQPPQLTGLVRQYGDEFSEDASDRLWALLGSLLHDVLEGYAEGLSDTIAEQKLEIEVDGWTVVGKYDLSEIILEGERLTDWKLTSIYSLKEDEPVKFEWEAQINCYVELLRQHGRSITEAQIVAIGRDWSKSRARREKDYPQRAVTIKSVSLWDSEKTIAYIRERVALHAAAQNGIWPECTPEDRWARPDLHALMKKGQKKAVKLFEDPELAQKWLDGILGGSKSHYIQHRTGESVRCAAYCPAAPKCKQWAKLNPTLSDTLKESIQVAQQMKENAA